MGAGYYPERRQKEQKLSIPRRNLRSSLRASHPHWSLVLKESQVPGLVVLGVQGPGKAQRAQHCDRTPLGLSPPSGRGMPRALGAARPCFRAVFWRWCCSVDRGQPLYCDQKDVTRQGYRVDRRVAQVLTVDSVLNPCGGQAAQVSD